MGSNDGTRTQAIRLAALFGAIFLFVGLFVPFFPVWLRWRGLTNEQIALALAAPLFVRLAVTPAITLAADRNGDRRVFLIALASMTLVGAVCLYWSRDFATIAILATLIAVCWATLMPLSEAVVLSGLKERGLSYGRLRLWGSIAFILASVGGGRVLDVAGPGSLVWMLAGAAILLLAATLVLSRPPQSPSPGREAAPRSRAHMRDVVALLRSPAFLTFIIAASAVQSAHAVYYTFGTLHWRKLGLDGDMIGALWAVGVVAEIAVFMFSATLLGRFGAVGLIVLGGVAAVMRWAVMVTDPQLWMLLAIQLLHGLTFGAAHLGAVHALNRGLPDHLQATGQGLYATFSAGIVMGAATYLSGPIYDNFGARAYFSMAVLGGVGALAGQVLRRRWPDCRFYTAPRAGE